MIYLVKFEQLICNKKPANNMIEIQKEKLSLFECPKIYDSPIRKDMSIKYREALLQLSENYTPQNICCRDEQQERVTKFIKDFIKSGHAKESLYISGSPGLGKTMIVNKIFENFKRKQQCEKKKVKFISLNAMRLKQPSDVYKVLYAQLASHTVKPPKKLRLSSYSSMIKLDMIFRQVETQDQIDQEIRGMKKIVFIDEIDYLKTKQQEILYNLFDWAQYEQSKLAIISISNTLDFTDKLKQKIKSRLGNNILCFKPYESKQLEQIMNQRLQQVQVFQRQAISSGVKKVAQTSSDLRKCLHIFRQAILLHTSKPENKLYFNYIQKETVLQSYENTYCDYLHKIILKMPKSHKIVMNVLAKHFSQNDKYIPLDVIEQHCINISELQIHDVKTILLSLVDQGLLDQKFSTNHSGNQKQRKWLYKLLVASDKIMSALQAVDMKLE